MRIRSTQFRSASLVVWILVGVAGCAEKIASTSYPLTGTVFKVEPEKERIFIAHDEIPGFMKAMTMPFPVSDRELLDSLKPGDKVEATLKFGGSGSELVGLRKLPSGDGEPQRLVLDTSGGVPRLRDAVKPLAPGAVVPDFAMTTQAGKPLKLSDLRGKVVVLTFIFTRCPLPDFCPRMDAKFAELSKMIAAVPGRSEKVSLLSVSFDPEHDTPEVLARHAGFLGAKPPLWQFAVASHEELRKVVEPLGLMYGPTKDTIVHTLSTAMIGPDGKLIRLEEGRGWSVEDVFKTVRQLLRK